MGLDIELFRLPLHEWVLVVCIFPRMFPFHLSFQIFPVLSLSIRSVVISSFIPDIGNLCLPSFFSWSAWPEVYQFCLFREPAFDVWVFFIFYRFSILLISILYYFFNLIILDLVYFSSFSDRTLHQGLTDYNLHTGQIQPTAYFCMACGPQTLFMFLV